MDLEYVTRLHLKTDTDDRQKLIDYCLGHEQKYLAIGWSSVFADKDNNIVDMASYYQAVQKNLKARGKRMNHAINVFRDAKPNDLFWTRDLKGFYWICRATGKAEPKCDVDLDIGAVIPVEAYRVGMEVPGQIKASFNRPRGGTAEDLDEKIIVEYSKYIYNKMSGSEFYEVVKQKGSLLDNLPDFELEELVISYIQLKKNFYVLSNSIANKSTTIKIECEFISRDIEHPQKAVVQVKGRGASDIDALDFQEYVDNGYIVFLYAPKVKNGEKLSNCIRITDYELERFFYDYKEILPQSITRWENLFVNAHKEAIRKLCEERLMEMFPAGIPAEVKERYKWELEAAENARRWDTLYVYEALSDEARKQKMPIFHTGNVMSSLLVFLLGDFPVNPLKAYYYCDACGHFEYVPDGYSGVDVPEKKCPVCHKKMKKDGFSLNKFMAWGKNLAVPRQFDIDYYVPDSFLPIAESRIKREDENSQAYFASSLFQEDFHVSPLVTRIYSQQKQANKTVSIESLLQWRDAMRTKGAFRDAVDAGVLTEGERKYIEKFAPSTVYDMSNLICADHCTWVNSEDDTEAHLFYSRDALMDLLLSYGCDEERAYSIAEYVRMGKASTDNLENSELFKNKWQVLLNGIHVPEEIIQECENCFYLPSRSLGLGRLVLFLAYAYSL